MKFVVTTIGVLAAAGLAHAGGKAKPGTQHNPPRFVDESTAYLGTVNRTTDGYLIKGDFVVLGAAKDDRARLEWTSKGKVVATAKCKLSPIEDGDPTSARAYCEYDGSPIKAAGPITANLIYEDDKDDTEWLLRSFTFEMKAWDKNTWSIVPDDMLGAAYVWHGWAGQIEDVPIFRFWVSSGANLDGQLRCSVDGKKLPDYNFSAQANGGDIEADVIPPKGERKTWRWQPLHVTPEKLKYGMQKKGDTFYDYLGNHVGAWTCQVRRNGVTFRELSFKVNAKGRIDSAPWQAAKDAPPLPPSVAMIEVHVAKDNGVDQRVKPDLLKKSRGWGLAWPADPSVKTMLAALPPASENANPVATKPKGSGKLVDGLTHSPPRFVDESTPEIRLQRNMDGYSFYLFARVAGVNGVKSDQYRLDWKSGGKVVSTAACEWGDAGRQDSKIGAIATVNCTQQDKPVMAKGAIEAQLIYHDDEDGNDYLVRTFKINVVKFKSFGDPLWQIVPDDVLGAAWAHHNSGDPLDTVGMRLVLYTWFARSLDGVGDMALRCTVDGTKLDKDLKIRAERTPGGFEVKADSYTQAGKHTIYNWTHVQFDTDIYVGPKDNKAISKEQRAYSGMLAEHPGKWDCALRLEGKAIRQFLFTVSPDGWVVPTGGELATGKGAVPSLPWVAPIEVRIPKDSKFDERVRPDAMKKSRGFGLAWPDGASIKATHASFPAASGLPDPK